MEINLASLTESILQEILEKLPEWDKIRHTNPDAIPQRGEDLKEWVQNKKGNAFAITKQGEDYGYIYFTPPSFPASISYIYTVLLPTEDTTSILESSLRELMPLALRYNPIHKFSFCIPSIEEEHILGVTKAGFEKEAVLDEAIYFNGQYIDCVFLGKVV